MIKRKKATQQSIQNNS